MPRNNDSQIRCSFCGRREDQASRFISGPGVCICSDCVQACSDLLRDEMTFDTVDALKAAVDADCARARAYFAKEEA